MAISETIQLGFMGAGTLIVALLACENKLDDKKLTDGIKDMIEEKLDLEVDEVDCPKDIKVEAGKKFDCDVTVKPKGKIPVEVEIKDDSGSLWAETKYPVFNPKKFKDDNDVDCGKKVRVLKGDEMEIKCKKDGQKVIVTIDEDGNAKWKAE